MVQAEQVTRPAFQAAAPPNSNISLDALIQVWADRGAALPTAVVGAVFCDLLTAGPGRRARRGAFSPTLRDVHILADGRAWLDGQRFATDVHALGRLLVKAIADGPEGEHQIPPQAFGLCANLMSRDPQERPSDPEQLCDWMRRFLGPPAQQDEVRAVVDAVRSFQQSPPVEPSARPSGLGEASELSEVVASERPVMEAQESALSELAASMVPGSNDTYIDPNSAVALSSGPSPMTDEELDTLLPAAQEIEEDTSLRSDIVQIDISNRSLVAMATSEIETPLPVDEPECPSEQLPVPSDQTVYPEPLEMVESPSSYGGFDPPMGESPESESSRSESPGSEPPIEVPPVVELAEAMSGYVELDEGSPMDAIKKRPPPSARPEITDSVLPHPAPSTRVKVQAAPAARRSARPTVEGADSLLLPSERGAGVGIWIGVMLVIAAVVYFYVF